MSKAVFQFVHDVARHMQSGCFWKKAQAGLLGGSGLSFVLAPVFLLCSLQGNAQQLTPVYVTKLVAGQGDLVESTTAPTGMGGPATSATMEYLYGIAEDKYGNLYFSDIDNCVIYEETASTGIINIIAGTGTCGNTGDGPALTTELDYPAMLSFDNSGDLVFADETNEAIRKIVFSASGNTVVTIAGFLGTSGYAGDGSVANTATKFHSPYGVTVDKFGNIDIADEANYRVRQINYSTGVISTIAGTGTEVNTGVTEAYSNIPGAAKGNALTAGAYTPYGLNVDAAGNLYWGTYGDGTVDMYVPPASGATTGSLYYIAGTGSSGHVYAGCTDPLTGTVIPATTTSGCATASTMDDNRNAVADFKGNIIASDEADVIRWISNDVMSTIMGQMDTTYGELSTSNSGTAGDLTAGEVALASSVYLDVPYAVQNDWYNNLFITDTHAYQLAEATYNTNFPATSVTSTSVTQTIYNEQTSGSNVTLETAAITRSTEFTLGTLSGCALGSALASGAACQTPVTFTPVYPGLRTAQLAFTDSNNNVSPIGLSGIGTAPEASFSQAAFTTLTSQASAPRGGVVDSAGNIYFADSGNDVVRKIAPGGVVSIIAGTSGTPGYSGDNGLATSAKLNAPSKVAIDFAGDLFIADTGNNVIREISAATGYISTVAGNGTAGYSGDNGLATSAELNAPQGIAVDPGGRVYVSDTGNNVIRYFGVGGLITTIAGNGTAGYAGDGGPSGNSELNAPTGISVDLYGDIYIADTGNDVVRVITATTNNLATFGNISTFAGEQGQSTNSGVGNVATQATLDAPSDVAVDAAGDVYITAGGQVFVVNTSNVISLIAGTGAAGSYSGDGTPILTTILPAPASNIAIDGAANLYVFDTAANLVLEAPLGTPTTMNLGQATQGTTGAAQVVVLTNTGNSTLTLTGISSSNTNFIIDTTAASACSSSATLAAGQSCTITVAFSPAASLPNGTVTGSLIVTDNSLNNTSATQSIPLTAVAKVLYPTSISLTASPASPVYGASYSVTAVVSGGNSPTGTVSFTVNGVPVQSPSLPANETVSINLTATAAGVQTVAATYSGDSNNAASKVTDSITVQQAVLAVTATNASMTSGSNVPTLTYTTTGFVNGDTSSVLSGAPSESTTATANSPAGTYPITITQGSLTATNYSFNFVNGTMTVTPPLLPDTGAALPMTPVWAISTIAGTGTDADTDNGEAATSAEITLTHNVAVDKAGNIFLASSGDDVIREINAKTGIISIVAGMAGESGYSGDGGPATSALLNGPYSVNVDNNGNLLIADSSNQVVRRVNMATGIINTVAGTGGTYGYSGDGGPATSALLYNPYHATSDAQGNIYIADYSNDAIRKVNASTGIITTFAGTGAPGYAGDGGPASAAYLYAPYDVEFDPAGNMLIAEYDNETIRKVTMSTGIINTIAGVAGDDVTYSTTPATGESCATDSVGDGCPATEATFNHPRAAVGDAFGNVFICDEDNYMVRQISPNGIISIIGGTGTDAYSGDGGVGTSAEVTYVYGDAIDLEGNLIVADPGNYRIRKLSLDRQLATTAVGSGSAASDLYLESSAAYTPSIAQVNNNAFSLAESCPLGTQVTANSPCESAISFKPTAAGLQTTQYAVATSTGNAAAFGMYGYGTAPTAGFFNQSTISTIAGNGTAGSTGGNGSLATAALVNAPRGGVVDSRGFIYFADSANNVIRRISPTGGIVTLAGTGTAGYAGDGGAATAAELNAPSKVVVDPAGNLYIADTGNSRIRYVNVATGVISTAAGNGTAGYTGDGGAAASAELNKPQGLAIDLAGNVYVADTGNNAIRIFGLGGYINTLTGTGTAGYTGDGGNAYGAELNAPQSVALDLQGDIYIADTGNDIVRIISAPSNTISTFAGEHGSASNGGDGGTALVATLNAPTDLAFDPAGDLYIAAGGQIRQVNTSNVIRTIAGTGATGSYSGEGGAAASAVIPSPASNLIVDNSGDVYIVDTTGNRLLEVTAGNPATLNLGAEAPGSSTAPQIVTLQNTGNSTMTISAITASTGFTLQTVDSTSCADGTTVAAGASCTLSVVFSPPTGASGAVTGTLTITDNSLNSKTGVTQTVALLGTAQTINATTTALTSTASTLVYGTSTTVTASVTGTSPTGSVSFNVNGISIGSVALASGTASTTLPPSLSAGTAVVTATYSGDSNNSSSSGSVNVTITPAKLTVTAANTSFVSGATSMPALTYTVAGFVNGDTAASATTGAPLLTTTATLTSAVGTYPITITAGTMYAANYALTFVNGTLTVDPLPAADFSFTATPASLTVTRGSTGAESLTMTPLYGYQGTIALSCGTLPTNVLCNFTSTTATTSATGDAITTTLTISTNDQPYVAGSSTTTASTGKASPFWLAFGIPLFGLGMFLRGSERRKWLARLSCLLLLGVIALGATSCSENIGANLAANGTYSITVTATDKTNNLSHTATFSLTIQSPVVN